MAGVQEENRRRIALLLIGLGAFLVVLGIVLGVHHRAVDANRAAVSTPSAEAVRLGPTEQARLIQWVLFELVLLVGILAVSLYAFKLWSRRFRQMLLRKPAAPTPSEDVWAMHRLPEEAPAEEPGTPDWRPGGDQ